MKLRESAYYDGNFDVASQVGPTVPFLDPVTRSSLFRQTFWQRATFWRPRALSSRGPHGAVLVEETEPTPVSSSSIVEWTRVYAHVPGKRHEGESYSYAYQFVIDSELAEAALTVQSVLTFDYFHTLRPETIPLDLAFRLFKLGSTIQIVGVPPSGDSLLAEDQTYRRWRGNIYERVTRTVPTRIAESL